MPAQQFSQYMRLPEIIGDLKKLSILILLSKVPGKLSNKNYCNAHAHSHADSKGRFQKPQARKLSVGGPRPGPPRTRIFRKVSGKKLAEKGGTPPPLHGRSVFSPKTASFAQKTPFLGQFLMDFFLTERGGTSTESFRARGF